MGWYLWSVCVFCFFKQKTAYEMRISDWSSDVCSSDLRLLDGIGQRLETLGPQLVNLDDASPAASEVRKLVGDNLPELVKGYGCVPEPLRRVERNGKTPAQQLLDGPDVIDREIAQMTRQLARAASNPTASASVGGR